MSEVWKTPYHKVIDASQPEVPKPAPEPVGIPAEVTSVREELDLKPVSEVVSISADEVGEIPAEGWIG